MAATGICSIDGCNKPNKARGWCAAHWWRWKNHGSPLGGRAHARGDVQRYFDETVMHYDGDDCLVWPFCRTPLGYGQIRVQGRPRIVSRLVCERVNGPALLDKNEAAHLCGNGRNGCVSPRHLVWKTHAANMADMKEHGTSQRGERSVNAKLREQDVADIRRMASSMTQKQIASHYPVSNSVISRILAGKAWAHVPEM
jgi:hypothetical protein